MIDIGQLKNAFIERFGHEPRIFRAPARVNLIGEHTDYNEGFVMPFAIERAVYVAASPRDDGRITVSSEAYPETLDLTLSEFDNAKVPDDWTRYPFGVISLLARAGHELEGADLVIASDVPTGAGLSSSAAIEVSVATAIKNLSDLKIDMVEIAKIGQATENEFVGVRSGIMDQMASALCEVGHALLLDCRSLQWWHVPLDNALFVVCDTRTKHSLAESEYNVRRQECEEAAAALGKRSLRDATIDEVDYLPPVLRKRARHVVSENTRVESAVQAIDQGDLNTLGRLMNESHISLRDDFEVSCSELDVMSDICRSQPNVLGSRMTGGGFGGCTVSLVSGEIDSSLFETISEQYRHATGIDPLVYLCRPSAGAGEITSFIGLTN